MTAPATATCEIRQRRGLELLAWPAFDGLDIDVAVTTRAGGVSAGPHESLNLSFSVADEPDAVLENRRRVAAAFGAEPGDFVFARQVHGGRAEVVAAADRGRGTLRLDDAIPGADALVTADPGTVLAILVGDCVPIVLYDPAARVLACVHAGWRGTVAGIAEATLTAMADLGARPERVLAGIGPAIAPDRYQVGDEVAAEVRRCFADAATAADAAGGGAGGADTAGDTAGGGGAGGGADGMADRVLRPDGTGRWLLDLWTANGLLLAQAGVPDSQIHVAAVGTGPDPDGRGAGLFFSDRTARPCGRFALVARLSQREAER
jgi:polyphenol oxidase